MNRKEGLSVALAGIVFLFFMVGCQTNRSTVGDPPVPMKTVTQNSKGDFATFEFQLPEGWASAPKSPLPLTVIGYPESAVQKNFKSEEDALPFLVGISNYYYSGLALSEKDKQMYRDLFAGKTDTYEDRIRQSFARAATMLDSGSSNTEIPEVNFQYQHYDGANGKITEVQYSYQYNGKKTHIIHCYREDIPYSITGAFDDSVDLSSGAVALWVANTLKVTEHFTVDGKQIQKNSAPSSR